MENKWLTFILDKLELWVFHHRKYVYGISMIVAIISILGVMRLKALSYIVDDLPKKDALYLDLKFFEKEFKGIMPFEILIDCKKKKQASSPKTFNVVSLARPPCFNTRRQIRYTGLLQRRPQSISCAR